MGTDKELSDLLDFSMVSGPLRPPPPSSPPYPPHAQLSTLLRPPDIGKEACAKNTASIWTLSSYGLKSPRWG